MRITEITREKRPSDGRSVYRVNVTYAIGQREPRKATLLYDMLTGRAQFGSTKEASDNKIAIDMLQEAVEAYMTLVYYGWEGNDARKA